MFETGQSAFRQLGTIVAENTRPLVVWIGAGLSRPAGLPTWGELRSILTNELEEKVRGLGTPEGDSAAGKLRAAREQENYWIAFRLLRDGLGEASYRESIRNALRAASIVVPPQVYKSMWRLRLSGVLNLNLDRLATRAFAEVHGGKSLIEFHGKDAPRRAHVLQSPTSTFVANLHGTTDDAGSWVFTDEDLKRLAETSGYREFVNACAIARTIIFMGISAEDVAAGGYLARLREQGLDFGSHFWITDRRDHASDVWAEQTGVRMIRYANPDRTHKGLELCIDELLRMSPVEEVARPVISTVVEAQGSDTRLSPPEVLVRTPDADAIRRVLNAEACRILSDESERAYEAFGEFCLEYDEAIDRAWYVPTNEAVLTKRPTYLLGNRLIKPIATGGFGTVYEAESPSGERVAVKLLHEAMRADPEHLQSFRRGVRSMRHLTSANVEGVVRYFDASEIPAFAVMEFVPGPTLHDAVLRRPFTWAQILQVGVMLAKILRDSHRLPQRVLHRDFRPKNIMFREEWDGDEDWNLVVLDFDLSWHKDSQEKSVTLESYSGYLAPEQVQRDSRFSTRNALVDSYGFGMTLYFLRARREPTFAQPGQADWDTHLQMVASRHSNREWVSLPRRFCRLILNSTRIEQPRRWDITQISGELQRLSDALSKPTQVRSAELLAEEVGARAFTDGYTWDPDRLAAVRQVVDEAKVQIVGDESARAVELEATWIDTGTHHWAQTKQWGDDVLTKATTLLGKAGWSVRTKRATGKSLQLHAVIPVEELADQLTPSASAVARVNELLIRT